MPDAEGYIPVYLPDRTVLGKAKISDDGKHLDIEIPEGSMIQELMHENLIGLSTVYQGAIPADNKKEKETDD